MKSNMHLVDYIETKQKQGIQFFLKKEAAIDLGISEKALQNSITRLSKKGKISYLKKGLYQIIPLEYEPSGSLPSEWIIDDLMKFLDIPYYVGLLSAAAYHGSTHQAAQIFQVICSKKIPEIRLEKTKICFYLNKSFFKTPTQLMKTPAGYVTISTPEGTAFDLIRYIKQSGHLNHIATVLNELAEKLDSTKLVTLSKKVSPRYTQRLGYILDSMGHESLTGEMSSFISQKKVRYIPLRADKPSENFKQNAKWHIIINEQIDPDL